MSDISTRRFDGDGGGPEGGGADRVAVQPDFANMTLGEIQAWEAAHNTNPITGAIPASAVNEPHLTDVEPVALQFDENGDRVIAAAASLTLIDGGVQEEAYSPDTTTGPEAPADMIQAQFSLGEPFVHVVAYLTQGPVEIVATPLEALELYQKLGVALGQAQRAGVIE